MEGAARSWTETNAKRRSTAPRMAGENASGKDQTTTCEMSGLKEPSAWSFSWAGDGIGQVLRVGRFERKLNSTFKLGTGRTIQCDPTRSLVARRRS